MNQKFLENIQDMEEDKHVSKTMIPNNQMHHSKVSFHLILHIIHLCPITLMLLIDNKYQISNFITLPIKNLLNCNLPLHQWCTISYINFPLNHVKTWGIVRWKSRLMIHQSFFIYFIWQIKNEVNQPQILPCS